MIHPAAKVSEEVNSKLPAKNTAVQLLTIYTTPSATMHSVTDGQRDRQTTLPCQEPITLRAVQSANKKLNRI